MKLRLTGFLTTGLIGLASFASALTWVGNTKQFNTGLGQLPSRASYVESYHTVSVTTQTTPIEPNQRVVAVVSTDGWRSSREYEFSFDFNTGNNTQWYVVLGPLAPGTPVDYYVKATGPLGEIVTDGNGGQNFGFYSRYAPRARTSAILQWFATDYVTIMKRLPEVINAGYGAIYLPSPVKCGGGALSVGYNPFDRFDLGDRLQKGTVRTQYGTTQELIELIRVAHRLGLEVYADMVTNHNDNRASTAINYYPDMIPEDFHIRSSADTGNSEIDFNKESSFSFGMLNYDLVGLADVAQEDGNNTRTGNFTLPPYATFNQWNKPSFVRNPLNPQYYPSGQVVAEDVRQYLKRWGRWLAETVGFDGFRIDAVKHTPPSFFGWAPNQPGGVSAEGDMLATLYRFDPTLFIFGEDYSSNAYELREYAKSGMNLLDFPAKFAMDSLFNSNGFGSLAGTLGNGYGLDPATGLPYEKGGLARDLGVIFAQSHDDGPPTSNNLQYAFMLSRVGRPKVYFDGNNIQPGNWSNFPRPGRADALGLGDSIVTSLLDARNRFGRGDMVNRYSSASLYIFERQVNGGGVMLVGLNNRGDQTPLTQTVATAFEPGTVLIDRSGQQQPVVVQGDGSVRITVPSNYSQSQPNNGTGYVVYCPRAPQAVPNVEPVQLYDPTRISPSTRAQMLPFTQRDLPAGRYGSPGSFRAAEVTSLRIDLQVRIESVAAAAFVKLDEGRAINGRSPLTGTPEGSTDGYLPLAKTGSGSFEMLGIDVSDLDDGLHVLRVRGFADTGSRPGIFGEFVAFFYIRRGLATGWALDGMLGDMGNPLTTQQRSPSSNNNRLDALYAINDDRFLYLGLAGRVDQAENLTNGVMAFIDADLGAGTGLAQLSTLADDSGPAPRVISNQKLTAPSGFGADYAIGSFRNTSLTSSPEAVAYGGLASPTTVGAQAGLFKVNLQKLAVLDAARSALAFKPRVNKTDPASGLEIAIPLRALYPSGVGAAQRVGVIAALGNTGESGVTLPSSDPNRGSLGGRPAPNAWISNQFLPTQPNVTGDPGMNAVTLQAFATVNLSYASTPDPSTYWVSGGNLRYDAATDTYLQRVVIGNKSTQPLQGPINLLISLPQGVQVLNRTEFSMRQPGVPYILVRTTSLPPGSGLIAVNVVYKASSKDQIVPTFQLRTGKGIL